MEYSQQKQKLLELEKIGDYVFHGSGSKIEEEFEPRQAYNHKLKEDGTYDAIPDGQPAVFTSHIVDIAIFMAIFNSENLKKSCRSGFSFVDGDVLFRVNKETYQNLPQTAQGYVYVFLKKDFEKINSTEYVSYKKVKPVETIKISVRDLPENIEVKEF